MKIKVDPYSPGWNIHTSANECEADAPQIELDERVGCVAVYFGEHQNCLDGFGVSARCVYFAQGHWDDIRKEWTVPAEKLDEARRIYAAIKANLRNKLPEGDAAETPLSPLVIAHLRSLAINEAIRRHKADADVDGYGCSNGHDGLFRTCPHDDCEVVRFGKPPSDAATQSEPPK